MILKKSSITLIALLVLAGLTPCRAAFRQPEQSDGSSPPANSGNRLERAGVNPAAAGYPPSAQSATAPPSRAGFPATAGNGLAPTAGPPVTHANQANCMKVLGRWGYGPCQAVAEDGGRVWYGSGTMLMAADVTDPSRPAILGQVDTGGMIFDIAIGGEYACVAAGKTGLVIVDIRNPQRPSVAGRFTTAKPVKGVDMSEGIACLADGNIHIIDIGNPAEPRLIRSISCSYPGSYDVAISGNRIYFPTGRSELRFTDRTDPQAAVFSLGINQPTPTGRSASFQPEEEYSAIRPAGGQRTGEVNGPAGSFPETAGDQYDYHNARITAAGQYICLAANGYQYISGGPYSFVSITDVSNPAAPLPVCSINTQGVAHNVTVHGKYAFVADGPGGLLIIDISNPQSLDVTGVIPCDGSSLSVVGAGTRVYEALGEGGLRIISTEGMSEPVEIGSAGLAEVPRGFSISRDLACIACGTAGVRLVDITDPAHPRAAGLANTPGTAMDLAIDGTLAYVADGEAGLQVLDVSNPEAPVLLGGADTPGLAVAVVLTGRYSLVAGKDSEYGRKWTLRFFDISNPAEPAEKGNLTFEGYGFRMAASGSYAYILEDNYSNNRLRVIDFSNPESPAQVAMTVLPYTNSSRDIVISGQYALVARDEFVHIIDISRPEEPAEIGVWRADARISRLRADGTVLYVQTEYGQWDSISFGIHSVDISDSAHPATLGFINTPPETGAFEITEPFLYTLDYQQNAFRILDFSGAVNPEPVGLLETPGQAISAIIAGDLAFLANGKSGLRILDISEPGAFHETGHLDTPGYATGVAVAGSYAYLADGTGGLRIIDISDSAAPREAGHFASAGRIDHITISGKYAFVPDSGAGLRILDISRGAVPEQVSIVPGRYSCNIEVAGGYAFAVNNGRLVIVDISDPAHPSKLHEGSDSNVPAYCLSLSMAEKYAYLSGYSFNGSASGFPYDHALTVFDISDPANPDFTGSLYFQATYETPLESVPGFAGSAAAGSRVFMALNRDGLGLLNVANPARPQVMECLPSPDGTLNVAISGSKLLIADGSCGLTIAAFEEQAPPVPVNFTASAVSSQEVKLSWEISYKNEEGFIIERKTGTGGTFAPAGNAPAGTTIFHDGGLTPGTLYFYRILAWNGTGRSPFSNEALVATNSLSRPGNLSIEGRWGDECDTLALSGDHLVYGSNRLLVIMNITDPDRLVYEGQLDAGGRITKIVTAGHFAYLLVHGIGLKVVGMEDPANPRILGTVSLPGGPQGFQELQDLAITGSYACVANGSYGLRIINISNPTAPVETGSIDTVSYISGVAITGSYAYVADGYAGVRIVDISNPASPREISSLDLHRFVGGIAISGSQACCMCSYGTLVTLDISDPTRPAVAGSIGIDNASRVILMDGGYVFLGTEFFGGLAQPAADPYKLVAVDISNPVVPVKAGEVSVPTYISSMAKTGSRLYAGLDLYSLWIFDVSRPASPVQVWGRAIYHGARDVAANASFAYLACALDGLLIIDTSIPAAPKQAGYLKSAGSVQGVTLSGGALYLATGDAGFQIFDISNPASPTETGRADTPGTADRVVVAGSYAYVADGYSGMGIYDIANPAAPVLAGYYTCGGCVSSLAIAGSYAYLASGEAGMHVVDISNPAAPVEKCAVQTPGSCISVAVAGSYVYIADFTSALRVFDVSNPAAPVEKAALTAYSMACDVVVSGNYLFVAESGIGLRMFDISKPAAPYEVAFVPDPSVTTRIAIAGDIVHLAKMTCGLISIRKFTTPPPVPVNLTANAVSFNQIDLRWTAPEGARDGFHLERRTGTAGDFQPLATLAADRTGYSDTGLPPGTDFTYRIRAFKGILCSDYSAPAGAVTPACDPPVILRQPAGQSVWPGESVTLSVTAAGTEPLHYTWYQIAGGQALPAPGAANAPAYTTPALVESASFRVRVSNACGTAESAAVRITVESQLPPPGTLVDTDPVAGQLRFVPPCTLTQGSPADEPCRKADETPFTSILDSGLAVMETEVTRGMWAELRARRPELPPDPSSGLAGGNPELPVQSCTWREAVLFANLLSREAGLPPCYHLDQEGLLPVDGNNYQTGGIFCLWHRPGFRLPAETEYEWYSRAGTAGAFPVEEPGYGPAACGTCQPEPALAALNGYAWWCANSGGQPRPAGGKQANPWNLFDLAGNVAEWCQDWYGLYPAGTRLNYTGPAAGEARVIRGGSFADPAGQLRTAARGFRNPEERSSEQGFRLVRTCRPDFRTGGMVGVGVAKPERALHLAGDNAVFRLDRSLDSAAFLLVRTTGSGGILKAFLLGTEASGPGTGQFVIRDLGAAAGGSSALRMAVQNDGTTLFPGNVMARGFISLSTIRSKEEIMPLEDASTRLSLLHGVRFRWKDETGGPAGRDDLGFIAGEVRQVLPEAAPAGRSGEVAGVNYPQLLAVALEALKSQQAKLDEIARQRTVIQESLRRLEAAKPRQ